jgi:hypothetical protein
VLEVDVGARITHGWWRRARTAAIAAAVIGVVALPVLAAASSSSTSGNAAAIKLYQQTATTMNRLPAYVIHQAGYVRIRTSIGKHRVTEWAWGEDQFQKNEVATNETIVLVQHAGNVTYIEDTLRPQKTCAQGGACPTILPLQFVITEKAAFAGIVSSGTTAGCFAKESLDVVPYAAGFAWWYAVGNFAKAVVKGGLTGLTSRYPNTGQEETEVDWLVTKSKHFTKSIFRVAAAPHHVAYTFDASYKILRAAPKAAHVVLCS